MQGFFFKSQEEQMSNLVLWFRPQRSTARHPDRMPLGVPGGSAVRNPLPVHGTQV